MLNSLLVKEINTIKETMGMIDKNTLGIAFVVNNKNKFVGLVTDGDIRRAILNGINIKRCIKDIMNKNPIVVYNSWSKEKLKNLLYDKKIKTIIPTHGSIKIPILDNNKKVRNMMFISEKGFMKIDIDQRLKKGIKKVLVVGGAGYLGSILCPKLLNKGYKVRVLDNLTYGNEGIKELYSHPDFEFLKGDIRNISEVIDAIKGVDAVIHLAAIVGDPACLTDPRGTIEINYLATKSIAEVCKFNQINKFLFASTCSVYGANKTPEKLTENSPLNPLSLYAETKLKSEEGILELADENFFPTIFRFATLCGVSPRMRFDLVINLLTARAMRNKKITIFGGRQWRPNLDVSDAAEACLKWLESPIEKSGGEIFNIGENQQNYRILQIGKTICKTIPGTKIEVKKEKGDIRDYNVSFNKVSKILNFKSKKRIEKSILDIKKLLKIKKIKEFNHPKYNNYRFLL